MLRACGLAAQAAPRVLGGYLLLTLASGLLPVAVAWLMKSLIDDLAAGRAHAFPLATVLMLVLIGVATGTIPHVIRYFRAELDREVAGHALERLFVALGRQVGLERFENVQFLNQLRLAQQTGGATASQVITSLLGAGQASITIVGLLASLLVISPWLMVLVLLSGVPSLVAEAMLSIRRTRVLWAVTPSERREAFYNRLLSTVEAAKEVRLFGIGGYLLDLMLGDRRAANSARRKLDRTEALAQVSLGLLAAVVAGGGLAWAIAAVRDGRFTVGAVAIFAAAAAGVQGALATLAGHLAQAAYALSLFDHYLSLTSAGPDLPVPASPRELPPMRRGIELRDVWFRYSDDHPWVLREVNLFIPHGKAVALVGTNGTGKSTLVKLLTRFYDPTQGVILWDGTDIRDVDPDELRRRVGAVFQDYMEYDMTARENIGLGDLDALHDQPRIERAADLAGIHGEITGLPNGYDTLLSRIFPANGSDGDPAVGVVLSGGQWQRLALARALLREHRDLIILDEPSSGLDAHAERRIHTALRRHRSGRTSVLISHRLSAVRDADVIVVIAQGRVAEQGNHATLMAAGGEYARLFTAQATGYRTDSDQLAPASK